MVSIILILSIGSISLIVFSYVETSIVSNKLSEMEVLSSIKQGQLENLHTRASEDILFAVKNPAFVKYFELPESKMPTYNEEGVLQFTDRQRAVKMELDQWIFEFQKKFAVDETCLIHNVGQEHTRLVLGEIALDQDLSSEEGKASFFGPSFTIGEDQVHAEQPYLSPDTNRWVFAYSTPIVLPDGSKPAIFHFEMPMIAYQKLVDPEIGRMFVLDPEGYMVADSATDFDTIRAESEDPADYFPSVTEVSTTLDFADIREKLVNEKKESDTTTYVDNNGQTHYLVYANLPTFEWLLVYDMPYSELLEGDTSIDDLKIIVALAAIGVAAIALFIAYVVAGRITHAMKAVAESCKKQVPGKLELIRNDTNDELQHVVRAINGMVTKIKNNESQILSANEELVKLDKMKSEFLSVASHELKTPIQPILSYAELGKQGKVSAAIAFEEIRKQAIRLARLANDILDVSKVEGGRLVLTLENVNLKELMVELVRNTQISSRDEVMIDLNLNTPDTLFIIADKALINQVFSNILGNAIKFTKKGAITIETNLVDSGKSIQVAISDTGPGIDAVILPKLFEKFASKNGPRTGNEGGTGLGLFLSKSIVEAHHGSITAINNENGGATFRIVIPTTISSPTPLGGMKQSSEA